jgi:hypothetical protein
MDEVPAASKLPDPDVIRRTAAEVVQRPHFQIEPPPESGTTLVDLLLKVLSWIVAPFRWLFNALEGLPDFLRYLIVIALVVILVVLIGHMIYSLARLTRGLRRRELLPLELQKANRDPAVLERQALEAGERADYILAVRLLFSAGLVCLEQSQKRRFRAGTTNREVLRRHRDSPLFEPLQLLVGTIEAKWYGFETCGAADYEACRSAYARIARLAKESHHADRA